jgi:hypothetical protein
MVTIDGIQMEYASTFQTNNEGIFCVWIINRWTKINSKPTVI